MKLRSLAWSDKPAEGGKPNSPLTLAKQAAIGKATHQMSYANCFAAALAKQKNAELITGDPEFKAVEKEIKINWLA